MNQLRGILLTIGLLSLIAVAVRADFEGGFAFAQSTYDQLNRYLEAVKPADPVAAMQEFTKLLHEEEEKAKKPLTFNQLRIKALSQITQLARVSDANHPICDDYALAVLAKNIQAVGGIHNKIGAEAGTLRPIDEVIIYYNLEHSKACQKVYPELLKSKSGSLNKANLHHVASLLNSLIRFKVEAHQAKHPEKSASAAVYDIFIGGRYLVNSKDDAKIIYDALKEDTIRNPDNKYLGSSEDETMDLRYLHNQAAKHLLERYLIQPCKYYQKELGHSLIEPALYDVRLHPIISDEQLDFYEALARYELCANIISMPKPLIKSEEHLAELTSWDVDDLNE